MGGYGSTRWGAHSKKICVESCLNLCVARLKHEGIIHQTPEYKALVWRGPGDNGVLASARYTCRQVGDNWELALFYTANRGQSVALPIAIANEARFIGRKAPVFLCPLCGRPSRKLYLPPGAYHFGCRVCHDLTYRSCQTAHRYDRGHMGDVE